MTGRSEPSPASGTANRMDAETEQICWYVMTGYALDKRRGMSIAAQVEKYNAEHGSDLEVFAPTFVKVYNEAKSPRRRMLPLAAIPAQSAMQASIRPCRRVRIRYRR